jgi:signal transduction histidine kinase
MTRSSESKIPSSSQTNANESFQSSKKIPDVSPELQAVLKHIVEDVVEGLGCVGAMVATLELDNALPVRAYSVDIAPGLLKQLEDRLGVTFISPKSVAYLNDKRFKDNLSVRAVKGRNSYPEIIKSNKLYDLFRPVVNKPLSDLAQRLTGIKQVIAVPFFLEGEAVGNLFAATSGEFSDRDIKFLTAFGHQAATAIQSQRRLAETRALERVILDLQARITDETQVLQTIVDAVVQKLGYVGAMVATLEPDKTLPVRAYAVDIAPDLLKQLEDRLGVTFIGPKSVAYLNDERFEDNLSVRAVKGKDGHPEIIISNELHDLFRPVVNKYLSALAQRVTGIKQVIAVPFFLEGEVVGNLFAATHKAKFSEREKGLLRTFGQQAAAGIRNARLYRKAEERRQVAEMFGKMAFSAAAFVHALRNHISAFQTYLQLMKLMPPERLPQLLESGSDILTHLKEASDILDKLHEPWRETPDVPVDVNTCLIRALRKVFLRVTLDLKVLAKDQIETEEGIVIHKLLSDNLPPIKTSPDMLTEAFRVLIKNAVEAIKEKDGGGDLWIESHLNDNSMVEVLIHDNGTGIKPENLGKIFELKWSTKEAGMGFGLFWAKDYVEGLGGSIKVESVWQEATIFRISFPASVEKVDVLSP